MTEARILHINFEIRLNPTVACLVLLGAARADGAAPSVSLFNGRDLTGWDQVNVAADTFRVQDGMIVTPGSPMGILRSHRRYQNFILEFDWQLMKYAGNSGVFVWTDALPAPGAPYPRGFEIEILDPGYEKEHPDRANIRFTSQGDVLPIRGARMTAVGRHSPLARPVRAFPSENRVAPSPAWNHYRVTCDHGAIHLAVNGKEVTAGKDCVPASGFICLESEDGEAHFKNLRLQELPGDVAPQDPASPYEGFRPIFNGRDDAGWDSAAEAGGWSITGGVNGSHLTPTAGPGSPLTTRDSWGDFALYVDWRLLPQPGQAHTKPAAAPAPFQLHGQAMPALSGALAAPAWNRCFIVLHGRHLSLRLNGQPAVEEDLPADSPAQGPIVLNRVFGSAPVEFGNLLLNPAFSP